MKAITNWQFFESKLLPFEENDLLNLQSSILKLKKGNSQSKELDKEKKNFQQKIKRIYRGLSFWEKTLVARHPDRPHFSNYLSTVFSDFIELHGDRYYGDDRAIIGGLAKLDKFSVLVVGHEKGKGTEMIKHNFGMANPEGYRKALRLFYLAEKYRIPIITLIDTPGAYPGIRAEERGQSEAIAKNLREMFSLEVPIIVTIIGEGGSGGALGIAIGNQVSMLENSIYSVISPEACASILWKDHTRKEEAAVALKNDALIAQKNKVIEEIIKEPLGGAHRQPLVMAEEFKKSLLRNVQHFNSLNAKDLIALRQKKFATIGL